MTGLRERIDLRVEGDPSIASGVAPTEVARCPARSGWCAIARERGARIHVLHISTGEEMAFLEAPQGCRDRARRRRTI